MIYGYALHVHHNGPVIEMLTEPIENRIAYIRAHKPASEQETRLRLLRQLTDEEVALLPSAWAKAHAAWLKADAARVKADAAWLKARPELEALHARICVPDCPWDGTTIFPQAVQS